MTSPLSQSDIDKIREELGRTTPGHWAVPGANVFRVVSFNKVTKAIGGESWDWYKGIFEYPERFQAGINCILIKDPHEIANNATWIANSKSHVTRLLAMVAYLQQRVKELEDRPNDKV